MLDASETAKTRRFAFWVFCQIAGDQWYLSRDTSYLNEILETAALALLDTPKGCGMINNSLPTPFITGKIREKVIGIAQDKKRSYEQRSVAILVLGRADINCKNPEQILHDARLALNLCEEISYPKMASEHAKNGKQSSKKIREEREMWVLVSPTEDARTKQFSMCALGQITGRTDCEYDIEKWRRAVAEMEARAMLGEDGGQ